MSETKESKRIDVNDLFAHFPGVKEWGRILTEESSPTEGLANMLGINDSLPSIPELGFLDVLLELVATGKAVLYVEPEAFQNVISDLEDSIKDWEKDIKAKKPNFDVEESKGFIAEYEQHISFLKSN
jgi:hypothetical protein